MSEKIIAAGWHGCMSATGRAHSTRPAWRETTWRRDRNGHCYIISSRERRVVAWDFSEPGQVKAELGPWEDVT